MTHQCPACKRSFAEPGFCPYDGKRLEAHQRAHSDSKTVPSPAPDEVKQAPPAFAAVSAVGGAGDAMSTIRAGRGKPSDEYDRLIGETLDGRYYVQRKIGEGGMGVVFAVKHTVIERPLAIKVLKREVTRDPGTMKRFIQEARAASRIGHPNIVDVTDFGNTADGMTYQVMELIDGTTLSKTIKGNAPLPVERVLRIGVQIARALVAAHAKGIVHRDLKPENVFLIEREGRPDFVKIVDFGIAKVQPLEGTQAGPRLTRQGSVFGTPEYMAPEQAAGKSDTDHRVDVYALGTILYEMLVGKTPHKSNSMVRTIAMQMLDPIIPPTERVPGLEIPKELEAIIMKALEKQREDRYATMADLMSALDTLLSSLAASQMPTHQGAAPAMPAGAALPAANAETLLAPARAKNVTAADQPASQSATPPEQQQGGPPRRAKPPTMPLHEPQFAASGSRVSFDHVYDEPAQDLEKRSRWPMIAAGLAMLLLGAGGAVMLVMKLQKSDPVVTTQRGPDDAALVVESREDASIAEPPIDALAIVELPPDAGTRVTTNQTTRDAGVGVVIKRPDKKGNFTIEVLTRPADANVFIGRNYRGPSGTRLTYPFNSKVKIECKTDRMKGSIEVLFDGSRDAVMCTATRDRFCVPGLKNPYDDCEEDPNASP